MKLKTAIEISPNEAQRGKRQNKTEKCDKNLSNLWGNIK